MEPNDIHAPNQHQVAKKMSCKQTNMSYDLRAMFR